MVQQTEGGERAIVGERDWLVKMATVVEGLRMVKGVEDVQGMEW